MNDRNQFPEGFLWGVSTSAHQYEGGGNSDWTCYEKQHAKMWADEAAPDNEIPGTIPNWQQVSRYATSPENYLSKNGVGFVEYWREDFDRAKAMGLNTIRFSIEWAKVEPQPDQFDQLQIDRYREMVVYALELGLTPFVTLHHFTNPAWFVDRGGWESRQSPALFERYVRRIVSDIDDNRIKWIVLNEPEIMVAMGWVFGHWLPNKQWRFFKATRVFEHYISAHKRGYRCIHEVIPSAEVSSAVNASYVEPVRSWRYPWNLLVATTLRLVLNRYFLWRTRRYVDYVGLNHYLHCRVDGGLFKNPADGIISDVGWLVSHDSLAQAVRKMAWIGKPIYITEHGVADERDVIRPQFLRESLRHLKRAIDDGADVRGYLHWSLLDNFEWEKGWWPKFGLIAVDRDTMERIPRKSAKVYSEIILSQRANLD